jgi:RNA polymerase sigma-70 factor (ECF subfamily)
MPDQHEFMERAAPFRAELTAHCYRMLGSVHDAEDLVQETYLRGWRAYPDFAGRSSLRTWLYRIATSACLRALENRGRRALPTGLAGPTSDPDVALERTDDGWLSPFPDAWTAPGPEAAVAGRQSVRLAVVAALQELPARQRAVLVLREVVALPAAEVADLLDTTTAAVNSALQRARAHLAAVAPTEDGTAEPAEPERRALVDRYASAFERADVRALTELLQEEVALEMPPVRTWFRGRDTVVRFLVEHGFPARPGDLAMVPTAANGQAALAAYRRDADLMNAQDLHVLTLAHDRVARITVFLDETLFAPFGLPARWPVP